MKKILLKSLFCFFLCAITCFHESVRAMELVALGGGIAALWLGSKIYNLWNSSSELDFDELNKEVMVGEKTIQVARNYFSLYAENEGYRKYIVLNSANSCCLYSDPVRTLIRHLEGEEAAENLRARPDDLRHLEMLLKKATSEEKPLQQAELHRLLSLNTLYQKMGEPIQN